MAASKISNVKKLHVFDITFIPTIATTVGIIASSVNEAAAVLQKSLFRPSTASSTANAGWHSMRLTHTADVPSRLIVDKTPKNPFKFDAQESKLQTYVPETWEKHTVSIYGSAPKKGGPALYIALDKAGEKSLEMHAGSKEDFFVELVNQAHYVINAE